MKEGQKLILYKSIKQKSIELMKEIIQTTYTRFVLYNFNNIQYFLFIY